MANNDDPEHRFVSHGGRLRANEIEVIIKTHGFEKGVVKVLQLIVDRQNSLGQEHKLLAESLGHLANGLGQVVDVVGYQGQELKSLTDLGVKVESVHPDESN